MNQGKLEAVKQMARVNTDILGIRELKWTGMDEFNSDELWYWRRLLRVHWTAVLNEINLEYSLEGLMLKLKLQYFGHLSGRTDSLEKTLMLWKE